MACGVAVRADIEARPPGLTPVVEE